MLAAGLARRMGQAKLLLPIGGHPIVRHAVEGVRAAGLDPVLVVTGPAPAPIEAALAGLDVQIVVNPTPEAGQAGSVRAKGVEAAITGKGTDAASIQAAAEKAAEGVDVQADLQGTVEYKSHLVRVFAKRAMEAAAAAVK